MLLIRDEFWRLFFIHITHDMEWVISDKTLFQPQVLYNIAMKTNPYSSVDTDVVSAYARVMTCGDDYHRTHAARLVRTIDLLMKEKPKGELLEVGTSGLFPMMLKQLAPGLKVTVTHFDTSRKEEKTIVLQLCGHTITLPAYFINLEQDKIPADDEKFDIAMCCEVLEHMEQDPMFMLSEINRVLKPGGLLLLTTPNITSSRSLTKILSGVEPYFYMQYHKTGELYRHNYEYSVPTVNRVLSAAGFEGRVWTEDLFEDGIPSIVTSLRSAGYLIEHHGDNIIALARKNYKVRDRHPNGLYI